MGFECIVHLVHDSIRDACLADAYGCLEPVGEAAELPDLAAGEFHGILFLESAGRDVCLPRICDGPAAVSGNLVHPMIRYRMAG
jgi:hypothetical protein